MKITFDSENRGRITLFCTNHCDIDCGRCKKSSNMHEWVPTGECPINQYIDFLERIADRIGTGVIDE